MPRSSAQLRSDALQIWQAGVEAVRSPRLVRQAIHVEGRTLVVGHDHIASGGSDVGWDKQSEVPPKTGYTRKVPFKGQAYFFTGSFCNSRGNIFIR